MFRRSLIALALAGSLFHVGSAAASVIVLDFEGAAPGPREALAEATLVRPQVGGYVPEGKNGVHSEHLGFLLAEMQSLARAHPNGSW